MISAKDLQQVLNRARAGDRKAEEQLFEYLRVRFEAIARQRLRDDHAEDVAHDACLVVLKKYRELPADTEFEPWAYQSLRNRIGNYMRDAKVRSRVTSLGEAVEQLGDGSSGEDALEFKRILLNCLGKLARANPRYLRILTLVNHGYSTREICARLDLKPNHLYVLLHRSRQLLYDCVYESGVIP